MATRHSKWRFSLRSLIILTTVLAILFSGGRYFWYLKQREQLAIKFFHERSIGVSSEPIWVPPKWISRWLPHDLFSVVVAIQAWDVRDEWMQQVEAFPYCRRIHIRNSPLTSTGLSHLAKLHHLEVLYVEGEFDDSLFKFITNCRLKRLVLMNTQVQGHELGRLNVSRLSELVLFHCPVDDEGFEHIARMTKLKSMYLNRSVVKSGMRHLSQLNELHTLCLVNLKVSDEICSFLPPNVHTLYLRSIPLTDASIDSLSAYPELDQVQMIDTQITPRGADRLQAIMASARVRLDPPKGRVNSVNSFRLDYFMRFPNSVSD